MKKKLSRLLMRLAQKMNPAIVYENVPFARQMGITLHITKKDVRDWRKNHPECKSHRQGMESLIKEAKWQVAGAIGRGLMEKDAILFETHKTLYVADVSGRIFLYSDGKEENDAAATATEA